MKIRNIVIVAALLAGVGFAAPAQAADGWTSSRVNLREGPDSSFRMIASVPSGTPIKIYGCLRSWTWCDVRTRGARGWMAGSFIQSSYHNRRAYIIESGPYANVPVVVYRDRDHDRDRDWRNDRDHDHRWDDNRNRWDNDDHSERHDRDRYPGYGWQGGWRHDYND